MPQYSNSQICPYGILIIPRVYSWLYTNVTLSHSPAPFVIVCMWGVYILTTCCRSFKSSTMGWGYPGRQVVQSLRTQQQHSLSSIPLCLALLSGFMQSSLKLQFWPNKVISWPTWVAYAVWAHTHTQWLVITWLLYTCFQWGVSLVGQLLTSVCVCVCV
jgi:hypothetical protein